MSKIYLRLIPYFLVLRPHQWIKNILVFSGLIFSTSLFNSDVFLVSLAAFGIFCCVSSGVYIMNDLRDKKRDQVHPVKKNRPIASGKITIIHAAIFMVVLIFSGLLLAYNLDIEFFYLLLMYIGLNILYSFGLKNVVILDAMIVAMGFLIRAFAGCAVIHVKVTPWLFICSLTLALLLSFGKRRNEMNLLKNDAETHRSSLHFYTPQLLDMILSICGATAIGTYSLYTMAHETIERFGSQRLIMTTPFVIFGVFRYFYLIYTQNKGGDPTKLLVTDLPTIINGLFWILAVGYVIYGTKIFPGINL